jgi:hypothetical protein
MHTKTVPSVLAKALANAKDSCRGGNPGPWDQGHWANRK